MIKLSPVNFIKDDGIVRYNYKEMEKIIESKIGYSLHNVGNYIIDLLTIKDIKHDSSHLNKWNSLKGRTSDELDSEGNKIFWSTIWQKDILQEVKECKYPPPYCNFWHYQLDAMFRVQVRNDQTNTIYVGTQKGIDLKKLKKQPNDWQLKLLEVWNETFYHLADKHGKIKIELWW